MLQYAAAEFFYEGQDVAVSVVVPEGELIPKSEESFNHTARECRIGPDNKLYIQLGQPYNVPTKEKADLFSKVGMGGIIRMDQRWQEPRDLCDQAAQSGGHGLQPEGQDRSGATTIRLTAWATISRPAR